MKPHLLCALGFLAAFQGCRQADSVVLVSVDAGAGVSSVVALRVTMSNLQTHDTKVFPKDGAGTPVLFPTSLVLVIPRVRTGLLDIAFEGLDTDSKVVANGTAQTMVVVGGQAKASVVLSPGPGLCGNGAVDPGEQCDDGNLVSFDGCDFRCQLESTAADAGPSDTASSLDTRGIVVPDAQVDGLPGSTPDAGTDAGIDAVTDALVDSSTDRASDAAMDEAPRDTAVEAMSDVRPDINTGDIGGARGSDS
ncbi:MAG TPA: DUF4215 domain-containing protein, partial [Polyangia bacterium]|nr:DUF4215 domain-containing protein [Polyangia bacterium]